MATYQEKIASAEKEIQELQNRAKRYRQELKKKERSERTRRICQRGGYIEKVLPETITLTDENFRKFIDGALLTKFSQNLLAGLIAGQEPEAGAESNDTDAPVAENPAGNGKPAPSPDAPPAGNTPPVRHQQSGKTPGINPPEAKHSAV